VRRDLIQEDRLLDVRRIAARRLRGAIYTRKSTEEGLLAPAYPVVSADHKR
jgi:hypothetical protein